MVYEVEIVIDGKKHEVKVDASGNIEDESKDDADDKDEKHDGKKGEKEKEDDKD